MAKECEAQPNRHILDGKVVATLFFEPSTRTRLDVYKRQLMRNLSVARMYSWFNQPSLIPVSYTHLSPMWKTRYAYWELQKSAYVLQKEKTVDVYKRQVKSLWHKQFPCQWAPFWHTTLRENASPRLCSQTWAFFILRLFCFDIHYCSYYLFTTRIFIFFLNVNPF